jgi:isopenicillin N synthase-like dioxygenase
VHRPDGSWVAAPPKSGDGAILVNVGDMLQRWTAGIFRSAPHRVLKPGATGGGAGGGGGGGDSGDSGNGGGEVVEVASARHSAAFFFNCNAGAVIDPVALLEVGRGEGVGEETAETAVETAAVATNGTRARAPRALEPPITAEAYILERVAATYG